jgi:hypothetical protein
LWQSVLLAKHFVPSIYILEEKRVGKSLELHLQIAKKCRLRIFGLPKYALYSDPFVSGLLLLPGNLTFLCVCFVGTWGQSIGSTHSGMTSSLYCIAFASYFAVILIKVWTNPLLPQGIFQGLLAPGLLLLWSLSSFLVCLQMEVMTVQNFLLTFPLNKMFEKV